MGMAGGGVCHSSVTNGVDGQQHGLSSHASPCIHAHAGSSTCCSLHPLHAWAGRTAGHGAWDSIPACQARASCRGSTSWQGTHGSMRCRFAIALSFPLSSEYTLTYTLTTCRQGGRAASGRTSSISMCRLVHGCSTPQCERCTYAAVSVLHICCSVTAVKTRCCVVLRHLRGKVLLGV
jgi:hypothetical protein